VLKTPGSPWPMPESAADWLALMGGFSFALTNILLRMLRGVTAAARILAMFGGGAVLAGGAGLLGVALGLLSPPPLPQMSWVGAGLALSFAFLAANGALQYGASRLSSHAVALILLSEVVFASLSSVALGAAQMNTRILLGGALILAAAAWSAWPAAKPGARP
jgi:drug/metabolite transporter (DMT)-like permease